MEAALAFDGRRRIEHVAGRAAARAALGALVGDAARDAIVVRGDDGAPVIAGLDRRPRSLGLRSRTAVAPPSRSSAPRARSASIYAIATTPRACSASRRGSVPEHALAVRDADWPRLWALKEAAAKALHRGLLEGGLRATTLVALDPPRFAQPLEALVIDEPDWVIAIAYAL